MTMFLIGLIGFLGLHSVQVFASGLRQSIIGKIGAGPWKGIYSLLSLVFFVLLVMGFPTAQSHSIVFAEPPVWLKHLNALLIPIALVLVFAGSFPKGYIVQTLKHPMLVGVKIWALGHLLVNWDLTSFILFGSFLLWAVLVRISIKRRAVPEGSISKAPNAIWDAIAVFAGLGLSAALILGGHVWLFGVPPIPGT